MNNRYIYRAKQEYKDKWIYGVPVRGTSNDESEVLIIQSVFDCEEYACKGCNFIPVIPETVEQCSGVPDKNGTLMYEGDIINALFDFGMPIKSICAFRNGAFGLLAKQHGAEHFHPFTSLCNIKYEVVGNVYDNPELLEVE